MATKKIITVFGATGAQGGSVVKSILGDAKMRETWTVRGVTRDTTKASAEALEALGAEIVAADLNDAASVKKAIKGSYAVFGVTDYWQSQDPDVEFQQGQAMADGAKEAGVQHFIWSSLLNITKLSNGVLPGVEHFDSKARVEEYIRTSGRPATFFMPGFYMSNLTGGMFRPQADGTYAFCLPIPSSTPVPLFASELDTGKYVKGILLNREKVLGKRIYAATKYYTCDEIVGLFKSMFPEAGKTAKYIELSHEAFKGGIVQMGLGERAAEDLLQNMRLMNEFGYYGGDSLDESKEVLGEPVTTWEEYMKQAKAWAELK